MYTLYQLLSEYKVIIPIIQRDYAQGRKGGKEDDIRSNFIKSIYDKLLKREPLSLDFIYGSVFNRGSEKYLSLLDGQQRITTLYLLYWYLANQPNNNIVRERFLATLNNFSYETRSSSTDFCRALTINAIDISALRDTTVSKFIKNMPWFVSSWRCDPTIKSMLIVLDEIQKTFKSDVDLLLLEGEDALIKFSFLELEKFGLTDNLYIKMNARGKPLTEFENFKAKFEQFLENFHPDYKSEFSKKIDNSWTDKLWYFRENNTIDDPFIRFIYFVTQMLYFKQLSEEEGKDMEIINKYDFKVKEPSVNYLLLEQVYSSRENITFLFNALDNIEVIYLLSGTIFSTYSYEDDKVAIFRENTNLLENCLKSLNISIFEKVLLYTILSYVVNLKISKADDNLKDLVRVIRNLLYRIRALEKNEYQSYLRDEQLNKLTNNIDILVRQDCNVYDILANPTLIPAAFDITRGTRITEKDLQHEKDKANLIVNEKINKSIIFRLEDSPLLKGNIFNFDLENQKDSLENLLKSFQTIWSINHIANNSVNIIRALLTQSQYGINIGSSYLGDRWFYGNKRNWETILTYSEKDTIKNLLSHFLQEFANKEKSIEKIISDYLSIASSYQFYDLRYYLIKYSDMHNVNGSNLFTINNSDPNFRVRNLTGVKTSSWHINPYVRTVCSQITNYAQYIDFGKCWSKTSDEPQLRLKNGIILRIENGVWFVDNTKGITIHNYLLEEPDIDGAYKLNPLDEKDVIIQAVNFIRTLIDDFPESFNVV